MVLCKFDTHSFLDCIKDKTTSSEVHGIPGDFCVNTCAYFPIITWVWNAKWCNYCAQHPSLNEDVLWPPARVQHLDWTLYHHSLFGNLFSFKATVMRDSTPISLLSSSLSLTSPLNSPPAANLTGKPDPRCGGLTSSWQLCGSIHYLPSHHFLHQLQHILSKFTFSEHRW